MSYSRKSAMRQRNTPFSGAGGKSEMPAAKRASPAGRKSRREEKADETRRTLFAAAAVVVGKYGYEEASITRITEQAGVGNGTFYYYFKTRQELLDRLLPAVGAQLLEYIAAGLDPALSGIDRERARIVAYFEFFQNNRGFLRILNEAEVYAPAAFEQHIRNIAERYARALGKHRQKGELAEFGEDELEALVYMLMGARSYLAMLWRSASRGSRKDVDKSYISTYLKLVEKGLFARPSG